MYLSRIAGGYAAATIRACRISEHGPSKVRAWSEAGGNAVTVGNDEPALGADPARVVPIMFLSVPVSAAFPVLTRLRKGTIVYSELNFPTVSML